MHADLVVKDDLGIWFNDDMTGNGEEGVHVEIAWRAGDVVHVGDSKGTVHASHGNAI